MCDIGLDTTSLIIPATDLQMIWKHKSIEIMKKRRFFEVIYIVDASYTEYYGDIVSNTNIIHKTIHKEVSYIVNDSFKVTHIVFS